MYRSLLSEAGFLILSLCPSSQLSMTTGSKDYIALNRLRVSRCPGCYINWGNIYLTFSLHRKKMQLKLVIIFLKLSHLLSTTSLLGETSPRHFPFFHFWTARHWVIRPCQQFHYSSSNVCCVPTLDPALCSLLRALRVDSLFAEEFPVLLRNGLSPCLSYSSLSCPDYCSCLTGSLCLPS